MEIKTVDKLYLNFFQQLLWITFTFQQFLCGQKNIAISKQNPLFHIKSYYYYYYYLFISTNIYIYYFLQKRSLHYAFYL